MKAAVVRAAKAALYGAGLARARFAGRPAATLTVAMFHRVLPAGHPQRLASMDAYVLDERQFADALDVVERLYEPVSLAAVLGRLDGAAPLPPHAALVTFDDGWLDTLAVAAPELKRRGVPGVVFVPPAALDGPGPFWQERLAYSVRTGRLGRAELRAIAAAAGRRLEDRPVERERALERLIGCVTDLAPERREEAIGASVGALEADGSRHFVSAGELHQFAEFGVEVGCHGLTHDALTTVADPAGHLRRSRELLSALLDRPVAAMSFPHGRYTPAIADAAFGVGFRAVFTSDATINPAPEPGAGRGLFGRIALGPDLRGRGDVADCLLDRDIGTPRAGRLDLRSAEQEKLAI